MNLFQFILTEIDFYGTNFHLFFNTKRRFKTLYGGILTLFTMFLIITCIIFFGSNLFQRKNPTIYQTNVNEGYSIIDLKKEKVIFAFRMENLDGKFEDFTNKIYPVIYYYSRPSNDSSYRSDYKTEEYLTYHICNESDYDEFNLSEHYGKLFCLDWGGKNFGGYWDNNYIFYFEIRLYFCSNGETYSINNKNCTSMEDLEKLFNIDNPMLFSLYYPVYYFDHNSVKNPLSKKYKNYFYYLNHKLQKNDRIYIKNYILKDDQSWLFVNNKIKSVWGVDQITSDFSFSTEEQLTKENASSMFYLMNVYMTPDKTYYKRFYIKIQDVIAEVGGIIGVFSSITRIFCNFINGKLQKIQILEFLFDMKDWKYQYNDYYKTNNDNSLKTKKNINLNNNNVSHFYFNHNSNSNNDIINYNDKEFSDCSKTIKKKKKIQTIEKSNNINNNISIFSNNSNLINKKHSRTMMINDSLEFIKNPSQSILPLSQFNRNKTKLVEKPLTLGVILRKDFQIACKNCCSKFDANKNKNEFFKKYILLDWFYRESIETMNYLKRNKLILYLENFFLNEEQIRGLYFSRKISLNEVKDLKIKNNFINEKESIKRLLKYFNNIKLENKISRIDDFIYEILDDNLKVNINL